MRSSRYPLGDSRSFLSLVILDRSILASRPPPIAEAPTPSSSAVGGELVEAPANSPRSFSQFVFWLGLSVLSVATTILLLMPVPFQSDRLRELCDLAHLPLFAFLTWSTLMWRAWRDNWKSQTGTWKVALFWLVVGSVLEISQRFFDRGTSWEDALANAIGIIVGLSFFHSLTKKAGHLRVPLFVFAAILFVLGWGWSWYQLWHSYR